jgi:hypothetical protein
LHLFLAVFIIYPPWPPMPRPAPGVPAHTFQRLSPHFMSSEFLNASTAFLGARYPILCNPLIYIAYFDEEMQ